MITSLKNSTCKFLQGSWNNYYSFTTFVLIITMLRLVTFLQNPRLWLLLFPEFYVPIFRIILHLFLLVQNLVFVSNIHTPSNRPLDNILLQFIGGVVLRYPQLENQAKKIFFCTTLEHKNLYILYITKQQTKICCSNNKSYAIILFLNL